MKRDRYPIYVLLVLMVVYLFNFLDRQILSILAERIKADLGLDDSQLGFLYGTAFAVFYALFGIPLGRVADMSNRRNLIAFGLAFWSVMTATSALAQNFWQLAIARIGVGIGEASANPAAYSMLSDYFPPQRRATALALYSSGLYVGAGLGLGIGGLVVDRWEIAYPLGTAPFGLRGWQVAFLIVGLPGLLLAAWVRTLREPQRSAPLPTTTSAWREFFFELQSVLPPLTFICLFRLGGWPTLGRNVVNALIVTAAAALLIHFLGSPAQWIALGIGMYAAVSWAQALRLRDAKAHQAILMNPGLRYAALGFAFLAFTGYGLGFWGPAFFQRYHHATASGAGVTLGLSAAIAGWLGVTIGGLWSDRWRRTHELARLSVGQVTAILPIPIVLAMLFVSDSNLAYALNFPAGMATSLWLGPGASTVQDMVPARMRASASAAYLLVITFIGLALGPYTMGQISLRSGDLRSGMLVFIASNIAAFSCFALAKHHLSAAPHSAVL